MHTDYTHSYMYWGWLRLTPVASKWQLSQFFVLTQILSDEEGFDKLDEKSKKDIIRGGLLQIMKNSKVLNDTDDEE